MSKEDVQYVMSLLQSGVTPLFRLKVRKGRDTRLIRVMDTDSYRFHCVFADTLKEETVMVFHDSIKHGTLILEEIEEAVA